jgi:hypothetical protein
VRSIVRPLERERALLPATSGTPDLIGEKQRKKTQQQPYRSPQRQSSRGGGHRIQPSNDRFEGGVEHWTIRELEILF